MKRYRILYFVSGALFVIGCTLPGFMEISIFENRIIFEITGLIMFAPLIWGLFLHYRETQNKKLKTAGIILSILFAIHCIYLIYLLLTR